MNHINVNRQKTQGLRTFLQTFITLCVLMCVTVVHGQTLTQRIDNLRITSGTLAGVYYLNPAAGGNNWYFDTLGLQSQALDGNHDNQVRDYLNQYLAHATDPNDGYAIKDYESVTTLVDKVSDSDDAYAATMISLACWYAGHSDAGATWFSANLNKLKLIADANLVNSFDTRLNLTTTFNNSANRYGELLPVGKTRYLRIAQFIDNCQSYRGLKDFAQRLAQMGDNSASGYSSKADLIAQGLKGMFDDNKKAFKVSAEFGIAKEAEDVFYAGRLCQVFPQIYGVDFGTDTQKFYDAGWNYLNARGDMWWNGVINDNSPLIGNTGLKAPYMFLGYAALLRGDRQKASDQLDYFNGKLPTLMGVASAFGNIDELGWALRIENAKNDTTAPTIAITAPQNGATLANLSGGISGTASDSAGVNEVDVYLCHNKSNGTFEFWNGLQYVAFSGTVADPKNIAHLVASRNGTSWSQTTGLPSGTNLPAGSYTLFVSADDAAGNRSSARSDFLVSGSNLWKAVDIATAPDNFTRLLWTMPSGTMATWTLNAAGGIVNQGVNYGPISDSTGHWNARRVSVGIDGKSRVLWTHPDGRAALWTLDANGALQNATPDFGPIPGWSCVDVATSPADNTSRLLWVRTSGEMAVWNMSATGGLVNTGTNYGPVANWTARAVSIGGDGKTRVLWNNTSGEMTTWTLDNVGRLLSDNTHYGPISGWTCNDIATASDNTSRWLWNNTSGQAAVWKVAVNGAIQVSNGNPIHAEYGPSSGWNATALSVGADGKMRLIWNNVDARAQVWIFDIPGGAGSIATSPMFGAPMSSPSRGGANAAKSVTTVSFPTASARHKSRVLAVALDALPSR